MVSNFAKNLVLFGALLTFAFLILIGIAVAKPPDSFVPPSPSPLGSEIDDYNNWIDANWLLMIVTNRGSFANDSQRNFPTFGGLYYPFIGIENIKSGAQNQYVIFIAGLWIAAINGASGDTIGTVAEFSFEFSPGPLGTSALEATNDPVYRVYKLYRDSLASNPNQDYIDWPVEQGAPVDNLGRPEFHGKQTLWTVFNDGEPSVHTNNATGPFGLDVEIQLTVWAFDEPNGTEAIPTPVGFGVEHIAGSSQGAVKYVVDDYAALTNHDYLVVFGVDAVLGDVWHLVDVSLGITVLFNQTSDSGVVVDGMKIFVINGRKGELHLYQSASPLNVSPVINGDNGYSGGDRWYSASSDASGGELLFGGIFLEPHFWGATTLNVNAYDTVEIRWRPMVSHTDLNGDGLYTIGEPYVVDDPTKTQSAFMYSAFSGFTYLGFFPVPFTVWDVSDSLNHRQLNVVVRDRDQDHAWNFSEDSNDPALPNGGDHRFNYTWLLGTDYDPTGSMYGDGTGVGPNGGLDFFGGSGGAAVRDAMWMLWLGPRGTTRGQLAEESITTLFPGLGNSPADTFAFTAPTAGNPPLVGDEANALYLRYKIINAGSKQLNDMLVGLWFDPDLGDASDDLVGSDPLDDLFFCYNGQVTDGVYGSRVPAFGARLLEGPVITSANDDGWVNGNNVFGVTNLSLHGFSEYANRDPDAAFQTYNYLNGLDIRGDTIIDPTTGLATRFEWSGDPVTGTGFLDANPGDRKMLGSVGPLDLSPGDTQYVVWKLAVGQGDDNLNSITKAREILNKPIDSDNDGVAYYLDNCPNTFNPSQADTNGDGIGDACATPTDVDENGESPLPGSFALHQNYPNPFNPSTVISFDLPVRLEWQVTIFNMIGQVVRRFDGESAAGTVTFEWDASDFATGVYMYRAEAGEFSQTRKMLLLK